MLRTATDLELSAVLECDLCIVGAGAAGLALAHEWAGTGRRVVVLAGGGFKERKASQALYGGTVLDPKHHSWPTKYRVRRFGGTTNIWGGRCLELDDIDFEQRPYVPESGWPFGRRELDQYYLRASNYCESGAPLFDAAQALPDQPAPLVPGLSPDTIISTTIERFSRPTDFGKLLRRHLEAAPNVTVMLDGQCLTLRANEAGNAVEAAECASTKGSRFTVKAREYALAAGGIETTRILLASRERAERPLPVTSNWLGRGYMCHLIGTAGIARFTVPPEAVQYGYHKSTDGIYCRRRFWVSPEEQRRLGILNVIFRLHHAPVNDPVHGDPVLSAMYLVKDLILYEYSRKMREERSWQQFAGHLRNVVSKPVELSKFAAYWIRHRNLSARQLPSVVLFSKNASYAIEFQSEQAPDPVSCITLEDKRDALGMRQVRIDWRCNELDVVSVQQAYRVLKRAFERDGVGTIEFDEAMLEEQIRAYGAVGGHHIGTARMASSPAAGVTDRNAKLFGVGNCYVASGAAMPTSGTANPTFTIVALAIRLADHLKAKFATEPVTIVARGGRALVPDMNTAA